MKNLLMKPYEVFLAFGWAAMFFQGGQAIALCWAGCMAITLLSIALMDHGRRRYHHNA